VPPILTHAGNAHFVDGPKSFTPDATLMRGQVPRNLGSLMAAGLNCEGVEVGAGAGRALAERVGAGEPSMDLSEVEIAGSRPIQANTH
jgi:4-methylaminobutanoate oxidase (formaldehyde-forming)